MRHLVLTFLILFFCVNAFSQSCLSLGIEFNSQNEIDSFQINFPGCIEVEGDIKIKGSGIINLNGLNALTSVGGYLKIEVNPDLISLAGLSSLTSIGSHLSILGNYSLTNLSGLDSLRSIGGDLTVSWNSLASLNGLGGISSILGNLTIIANDSLTDLNGLNALTIINGELHLSYNRMLINFKGLDSLTSIGDKFHIFNNPTITDFSGMEALTHIESYLNIEVNSSLNNLTGLENLTYAGNVDIFYNHSLIDLNGLVSLTSIQQDIEITQNNSLKNLNGLSSLTSIGGWVKVQKNKSLKSLTGLENIDHNSLTDIFIENNDSLSTCAVESVCDYLASPNGVVSIFGNSTGCESRSVVEAICGEIGKEVRVKVFLQGAYILNKTMDTNLASVLANNQPFGTMPWMYQGSESINIIPNNMVDWVLVELRDYIEPMVVLSRRAGILLSNGVIADTNLSTPLRFYNLASGNYYLCVHHRNHFPVMSLNPIAVPGAFLYDFGDTMNFPSWGGSNNTQIELETGVFGMIAGDVNNDGILKYSGTDNDRGPVMQYIVKQTGSSSITTTASGYSEEDINMNSIIKYSGSDNDPLLIIQNLVGLTGSTSITSVYNSLVPSGIPPFHCGDTLLDKRDGQKYTTVQIGLQCWMAENLNIGIRINGIFNQSYNDTIEKYCYNDSVDHCEVYGGLYQWNEMMKYETKPGSQGICPIGWHIPSDNEWKVLEGTVDSVFGVGNAEWDDNGLRGFDAGINLRSTNGWKLGGNGSNHYGFNVLPSGERTHLGYYGSMNSEAYFWTSFALYNNDDAFYRRILHSRSRVGRYGGLRVHGYSVRCLRY